MDIKVTFKRPSLEAETEVGSFSELAGLLQNEEATLVKLFGSDMEMVLSAVNGDTALGSGTVVAGEVGEAPARRGRKPKGADPAAAQAPAPIPVPGAPAAPTPPVAPSLVIPADGGIPPFLARTADATSPVSSQSTAGSAPPPPLVPPPAAPPTAPAAPTPPGVLGAKVEAELRRRGTDKTSQDGLVAWLAGPGVSKCMPGATFEEAMSVILMTTDDKLAGLLAPLGIAA